MTRNYYTPSNYNADHTTFGGIIYEYDFGGYTTMSDVISDIITARKFDEKCKKTSINLQKGKNK